MYKEVGETKKDKRIEKNGRKTEDVTKYGAFLVSLS